MTTTQAHNNNNNNSNDNSWRNDHATIVSMMPAGEDADDDTGSDHEETSSWSITQRDRPLDSDNAIRVMDHAHIVLRKRLCEYGDDMDIFKFETSLGRFQNSEIELGKRLAWGNFADIYIVKSWRPYHAPKACTQEQLEAAEEIKQTFRADDLVVKLLRAHLLADPALYATGAADVVTEGTLLAAFDHPHIVSIKGRSVASVEGFASGKRDAFFLLLERLSGTLMDRMKDWQQRSSSNRIITKGVKGRRDQKAAILRERVQVMTELADAMAYLHDRHVIHRDLKLSNVGIDAYGRIKLVDFGLAKILPKHNSDKDTFLLTGNTGSVRYMAPEIGRGERYNLKADVFSFGILFFEVLNLEKAWNGLQPQEIRQKVHHRKHRPAISMFWPAPLKELLKATWSDLPAARLSMKHVHTVLAGYGKELAGASLSPGFDTT
jgi:serine/threonine protein kinase